MPEKINLDLWVETIKAAKDDVKIRTTISVREDVWQRFQEICKTKEVSASLLLERFMLSCIESQG